MRDERTYHSAQRTTAHLLYEALHDFHRLIGKMRCRELCVLWLADHRSPQHLNNAVGPGGPWMPSFSLRWRATQLSV
jgi:hypothetical protein